MFLKIKQDQGFSSVVVVLIILAGVILISAGLIWYKTNRPAQLNTIQNSPAVIQAPSVISPSPSSANSDSAVSPQADVQSVDSDVSDIDNTLKDINTSLNDKQGNLSE